MRLEVNPRTGRLLARLPRPTVYTAAEIALILLVAVQCARLAWTVLTPVGPVGDWRASDPLVASAGASALGSFDPFFRLSGAPGPAVVTALNLKLYGVREDRATGRGSAIIALPDGRQMSFAVGEEVMPGVTLAAVGFDNVTINRGGAAEQLFLDQTPAAAIVGAPAAATPVAGTAPVAPTPGAPPVVATPVPGAPFGLQPRMAGGRVTGLILSPGADGGQAFRAAGFAPGDVIVAINGQRVTSLEQARAAMARGGTMMVMVDRGGMAVPISVRMNR
ncbi:MAG TPA: type II secretion system protein N [Allosphingosinicella sp.]|nr:type II secretion system protein N [Allosphingosinicella sp.]